MVVVGEAGLHRLIVIADTVRRQCSDDCKVAAGGGFAQDLVAIFVVRLICPCQTDFRRRNQGGMGTRRRMRLHGRMGGGFVAVAGVTLGVRGTHAIHKVGVGWQRSVKELRDVRAGDTHLPPGARRTGFAFDDETAFDQGGVRPRKVYLRTRGRCRSKVRWSAWCGVRRCRESPRQDVLGGSQSASAAGESDIGRTSADRRGYVDGVGVGMRGARRYVRDFFRESGAVVTDQHVEWIAAVQIKPVAGNVDRIAVLNGCCPIFVQTCCAETRIQVKLQRNAVVDRLIAQRSAQAAHHRGRAVLDREGETIGIRVRELESKAGGEAIDALLVPRPHSSRF